jgi:hypothetical protein
METINVIQVNQPEWAVDRRGRTSGSFDAQVACKVGNAVETVGLQTRELKYYNNPEDKARFPFHLIDEEKGDFFTIVTSPFDQLVQAGFPLDFSEVLKTYQTMVVERRKEEEEKRVAKLTEEYHASWIHEFKVVADESGVEAKVPDLEKYIKMDGTHQVVVEYRGTQMSVERQGKVAGSITYQLSGGPLSWTHRNYGSKETVVKAVKKLIDEKIQAAEEKKTSEEKRKEREQNTVAELKAIFGVEVALEHSWNKAGYESPVYFLEIHGKNHMASEKLPGVLRKERISEDWAKDTEDNKMYNFGGLSRLTIAQVQEVIKVLQS